jgi:hypothetical protein
MPSVIFKKILPILIALLLIQSLFFKFSGSVETEHIFGTLDSWAASFGLGGIFSAWGPFGPKAVGFGELIASFLLLFGVLKNNDHARFFGGCLSASAMAGAIFFHIFTPLGIVVLDDGGLLFMMACFVFGSSLSVVLFHKSFMSQSICWLKALRS